MSQTINQTMNKTMNKTMNRTKIHEPWAKPWTINQGLTLLTTRSSVLLELNKFWAAGGVACCVLVYRVLSF